MRREIEGESETDLSVYLDERTDIRSVLQVGLGKVHNASATGSVLGSERRTSPLAT